ncbi:MAG: hypothetical protein FD180_615 [Planctomycetota bacterium]|nr:MAG: hypothetical protein FD180_615 [Planctomycetota bacterium]
MRAAILVLFLAIPAAAADPFEGLKRLDRVTVTDKDGDTVRGIVRSILRGRLSVQIEGREGLTGSLVFERKSVSKVEKTGIATEEELKAASESAAAPREGFAEPERVEPKVEAAPPPQRPVLEAFPPKDWSVARRDEVLSRAPYLRSKNEREFLDRFDEWREAIESRDRLARSALLKKFPPGTTWNESTCDRLRYTLAIVGRALTAEEREFVEKYEAWKQAAAGG